jgi:hypothetical protein
MHWHSHSNEWKVNLSFSRVSLLFLNSWRASIIHYYVTTHPLAIQKQHWHSKEAQIEPPLIECEWAFSENTGVIVPKVKYLSKLESTFDVNRMQHLEDLFCLVGWKFWIKTNLIQHFLTACRQDFNIVFQVRIWLTSKVDSSLES